MLLSRGTLARLEVAASAGLFSFALFCDVVADQLLDVSCPVSNCFKPFDNIGIGVVVKA